MTGKISALLVATTLLAAASTARATVLSDNLGEYTFGAELASDTTWLAASFGTDGSPYDLTSVVLLISPLSIPGNEPIVEIYTSVGAGIGAPGESVLEWHAWLAGFSGHGVFVQVAIPDAAAVKGVALSNALGVIVP